MPYKSVDTSPFSTRLKLCGLRIHDGPKADNIIKQLSWHVIANVGKFSSNLVAQGSRELPLLVLNEGESTLKVSLTQPASAKDALKDVDVLAHQTKKIVILVPVGESSKIVLNSGEGDCIIRFGATVSKVNYFLQLPSYSQLVTPINGAYLMIFTAVVLAATWACCIFRKRRRHAGVPYQELEMGFTESGSAANVETAEGWDQDWDDEWDEDAVKNMSGGHHVGSISANGLTSRSSNKDGWENDWDE